MSEKAKVLLCRVPEYDPERIRQVIGKGLEDLGLSARIKGRVTIKPNVVMAHRTMIPSAFTRAEHLDGLLGALAERKEEGTRFTITEKSGAAIPTSRMFRRAGYYRLQEKHRFRLLPLEEARKVRIPLKRGRIHLSVRTGREIADRDLLVFAPKLKTNVLVQGITAAIKLNMGILCDGERMWNHNDKLDEKIVDLLEVGWPDFIATDAVEIASGGNQLTQHGRHLGIVIMASNPVAHDVVCARILHLDPQKIDHIRLAHERGYGPIRAEDITIGGDIGLDEIRRKTAGIDTGYIHADALATNIRILSGEPYCRGGCHGVFLDWLYMIKDRKPRLWNRLPEWTAVIGSYKGDVKARRLMVIGSCSGIEGEVEALRKSRIRGCPPKHKTLVLLFFLKAGILNPLFRLDLIYDAYFCLFLTWCRRLMKGRF